jgi:glycosyltransferase involved in cell wall biosynthesis
MTDDRPLIAAAIIVKNEADHLRRCLGSIRDFCDEIVVVDTGSTDDTVAIAESFGAKVLHKPWRDDFAASRNFALDAVTAEWVLYIDADEELVMKDIHAMRAVVRDASNVMAFGLRMHTQANWTPYHDYRMWRHRDDIRFTGEIHESTMTGIMRVASETSRILQPTEIDILHHGYEGDLTAKHRRNLPLLLAELKVHPEKINLWNHLGRVHLALGRPDLAEQAWRTGIERIERVGPLTRFDVHVYGSLADYLIASGRDAQTVLDRGRELDPTFKTFTWLQVRQHMRRGDFEAALAGADELLAIGRDGTADDGTAYNLDMFDAWPRAARIDCLFELMRFDEVRAEIEHHGEVVAAGSRREKQLDVCDAFDVWRTTRNGRTLETPRPPIRLADVAFIIAVRVETADRLANVLALTRHIKATYDCRVMLGCEQPEALRALVPASVEVIGVDGHPDQAFHATRVMNDVSRHVDVPVRIHCDTDTLIPVDQMLAAIDRVRRGDADVVLPFSFGIGVPQSERDEFARGEIRLERVVRPRPMVGVPPGLCQVWSAEAFERAGMENERLIGWAPDDSERLERLAILDMRVERIPGPVLHMDHSAVAGRDDASEFHAISQAERERIRAMSRTELEADIESWPWRTRGEFRRPEPFDASDLTVLIPVRIDSPDRLRNLVTCTRAVLNTMTCRILVGIGDSTAVSDQLDPRVELVAIHDLPNQPFHRTRIINELAAMATTNRLAVVDTDVVVPGPQWWGALEALRHARADMVFPYDGRMVEVPWATHSWLERGDFEALGPETCRLIEATSVGGCFVMERASFLAYGMENERFVSWGYEDDERLLRAHKLGLKVSRESGVIYHVLHRRGPDSRPDNPFIESNATEVRRIKNLSDARLRAEVDEWPWKSTRRDVKVLFWNAMWHEDHFVVDPRDRGVEIVRDRSRLHDCDVVVVGLPMLTMEDVPPPSGATSVLLTREASAHVPGIDDETVTSRFDLVASHRRGSGLWCPYVPVSLLGDLPEIVPVDERVEATASAWISSDWDASGRVELLNELMLHMQVDSYGRVAKNTGDQLIRSHLERWRIASRYRFVLAFENAREPDYVTEKFFEPLMFGAVPVYLGAPNVADFAPGEHCYINASDFSSARELAEFLTSMSDEEYLRYHAWRSQPRRPEFVSLCEGIPTAVLSPLVASIRERRSPTPTR